MKEPQAPTPEDTKILSLDEILDASDVQYVNVHVPEWGGSVRFGSLDAGTVLDFIETNEGPAKRTAGLRLIIKSLVDANGKRIGDDKKLEAFKRKDSRVLNRLVDDILKLNGMDKAADEVAKNA